MKHIFSTFVAIIFYSIINASALHAQVDTSEKKIDFVESDLRGPRLGVMYIPGKGEISESFKESDLGRWMSLFGWQFEGQIYSRNSSYAYLVELITLVSGVEQGIFYPNLSLLMGIRTKSGYDFTFGPNLIIGTHGFAKSSLCVSLGKCFMDGDVILPINLQFGTSPQGLNINLLFGYVNKPYTATYNY